MLEFEMTKRFRKDLRRVNKRGKDLSKLEGVIMMLRRGQTLDERYRDHALTGDYDGFRECHVESDWLLVYVIDHDRLILTASRTGTHSDIFDE